MTNAIANTIAQQLGGNKFRAMTGATLVAFDKGLGVVLPRKAAKGINSVVITLRDDDTYHVSFNKRTNYGINITQMASHHGVFADQLCELFTAETGLYTSL